MIMYSIIQSLPTILLLASCLPTIVQCQHHRQLRHAPSNDNRQSNDYIDPIIMNEPSTQSFDTPTPSPSSFHIPVGEDTSLPPTYAFKTTTTSYHNDDAPYPPLSLPISAFQSKMTPSLVQLHSAESSLQETSTAVPTSQPSSDTIDGAPSKLSSSSTITPPTLNTSSTNNKLFQQNEQLSFTTSLHSASNTDDDDASASTELVHCNSSSSAAKDTSIEPYHIIELPYYYQIETTQRRSTIIQNAIVEQSILSAMKDHILTCDEHNDKEEDIRHRALSNEQLKSLVVAVSSDQSNKRECKYDFDDELDMFIYNISLIYIISIIHKTLDACSDTSTSQHCHIVEGKLTFFVQNMRDDNEEEDRIISKAYTTIELVFHSFDSNTNININRDTSDRLSYIGNNPVSLLPADELTEVSQDTSPSSEDTAGIFITIFLVLSVCGCLGAIVVLCTFSRRLIHNKEESLCDSDDEESQMKSRASNNTLSSSSGSTDPIDTQEVEEEIDWNRMVYIESLALSQPTTSSSLSRVPEDTSVDYGCADEASI